MKFNKSRNLFFLILTFIFFNFCIDIFSKKIISQITRDDIGLVNKAISDTSELLILGSSRARNHYNSKLIQNQLRQSVFNGGVSGMGLSFSKAVLIERIKQHKPRKLILDIAPNILADRQQNDKMHAFYPMLDIYPSFNEFLDGPVAINFLIKNLPCLKYNSSLYEFSSCLFQPKDYNDSYNPLEGNINEGYKLFYYDQTKESTRLVKKQLEILNDIIKIANHNKIELFLVISPSYIDFDIENVIKKEIFKVARANKVSILNFSNSIIFRGKNNLFYNQLHLNSVGANYFSRVLVDTLKKSL